MNDEGGNMPWDRRQFMKECVLAAMLLNQRISKTAWALSLGPCNCVNILLHGFFFMEFQNDSLIVATPSHCHHALRFRDHGSTQLQSLPGMIDFTNSLQAGTKNDFPGTVLQFSRKDIGIDPIKRPFFIDTSKPAGFACLMRLPLPADILPLRQGATSELNPNSGNVANSIKRLCGANAGTVVRLVYFPKSTKPFTTRSFYAEHCHQPQAFEVNDAFFSARKVFGNEFDLTVAGVQNINLGFDSQAALPDEISPDDEKSLQELGCTEPSCPIIFGKRTVEVATCPIFGVMP